MRIYTFLPYKKGSGSWFFNRQSFLNMEKNLFQKFSVPDDTTSVDALRCEERAIKWKDRNGIFQFSHTHGCMNRVL
jgi:hypothetical protein